jgi:succinate dehydrogenase / fumarate reductase cytochrome b subunit
MAAAGGAQAYATFAGWATSWFGILVGVGLSWAFFQHTLSGLRHFVMDIGAGFELSRNKFWANMTLVGSVVLTALLWLAIWGMRL